MTHSFSVPILKSARFYSIYCSTGIKDAYLLDILKLHFLFLFLQHRFCMTSTSYEWTSDMSNTLLEQKGAL